MPMARIYKAAGLVFPELEELDLIGAWEILGSTRRLFRDGVLKDAYFELETCGAEQGIVKCCHDLKIVVEKPISELPKYDVVLIPGGPGRAEAQKDSRIIGAIKKAHEKGAVLASVCTGAFIVAQAGLLEGKKATSYHAFMGKLADYGVTPVNERLVVNGRVITGAGPPASVDVGMKVVEMLLGPEALQKVKDWMTY